MDQFKKIFTMNFQLDFDPECLLAMSMIFYAFSKEKLKSLLLCDKMESCSEKLLHHHQMNFLLTE